jgi:orotate phosphoribosyltransferase
VLTEAEILEHFKKSGALLEGHFQLSSGLHSPQYLQCAVALRHPRDARLFGAAIAEQFKEQQFDAVVSPAIGGLIIGFAVAESLEIPFFWTERENGAMTVRRGFAVRKGENLLVVEDVITTGGSTRECIEAVEKKGATVTAAASIIDRSGGAADVGVRRVALATLNVLAFEPESCPLCTRGDKVVKPGSRVISNQ